MLMLIMRCFATSLLIGCFMHLSDIGVLPVSGTGIRNEGQSYEAPW